MIISCIVAVAKNNVIGKDNDIPWYLPADLKYFKKVTSGSPIIMGRNCFESIGRPLPNRTNIIVTRNPFYISTNCLIAHSIEESLKLAKDCESNEIFIIGGGHIYNQTEELWDKLYLTEVDLETDGDVFFLNVDLDNWTLEKSEAFDKDEKNKFNYTFKVYTRK